jgi:hypothetical protein
MCRFDGTWNEKRVAAKRTWVRAKNRIHPEPHPPGTDLQGTFSCIWEVVAILCGYLVPAGGYD